MKKLLLPAFLFATLSSAFATVRTVSNAPANPGQYTNYADAEMASSNGDTIYIHGSSLNYNSIVVTKPVVVIGTGHKPQKQAPLVSKFEYIGINASGSGAKLIGLECDYIYTNTYSVQNILISRCKVNVYLYFNYNGDHSNWTIESVVFAYGDINFWSRGYGFHDFFFNNCVFSGHLKENPTASYNLYVQNCIFLGATGSAYRDMGNYWCKTVFENCIFYGRNPRDNYYNSGSFLNTYNNCISYQSPDDGAFPNGINNQPNTNPQFVSYPGNALFDYTHNYQLQSASPGHLAGSDSKDIGLYGGTAIYNQFGIPRIPQMLQFNLTNSTVPVNGTLQVTIQAAVQQ